MRNYSTKCRKLTLYFLVLLSCIVVGYAIVTQVLTITGTSEITGSWDIKIDSITRNGDSTVPADKATGTVADTGNDAYVVATFDVELNAPGDIAIFDVKIKNEGSIPALLKEVTPTIIEGEALTDVEFSYEDITPEATQGKLAASGGTATFQIKAEWKNIEAGQTIPSGDDLTKEVEFEFHYDQDIGLPDAG